MSRERAIGIARAHLDAIPAEHGRGVREAVFISPHGKRGKGFWLVDLEPYPADKIAPAKTITSLLIAVETGSVQERGGRTKVDPEQQKAVRQHAERLRAAMENRKSAD